MNLKDALELAGVDYEMTLNRFSNNAMLLERFVKKFPNDKTFQELDAAVGEKRYEDVERSAHTLKGIAANLGFQYLSDLSAEVVNLVRSDHYDKDNIGIAFSRVAKEYDKVVTCVKRLD